MHLKAAVVPEHEVAAAIQIVVHLVDPAALVPGVVAIAVGAVDPVEPAGWPHRHGLGEPAGRHLDQHVEAVTVHQHEVVPAVSVHVASHVHVENFAPGGLPEIGRHRDQVPFRRRLRIEPGEPAASVGDQPVPAIDSGNVDEGHLGTQRGFGCR